MNRKPLQIYLNDEERTRLEVIRDALGEKTLSGTMKRILNITHAINFLKQ